MEMKLGNTVYSETLPWCLPAQFEHDVVFYESGYTHWDMSVHRIHACELLQIQFQHLLQLSDLHVCEDI
jgi:hypothetical protein